MSLHRQQKEQDNLSHQYSCPLKRIFLQDSPICQETSGPPRESRDCSFLRRVSQFPTFNMLLLTSSSKPVSLQSSLPNQSADAAGAHCNYFSQLHISSSKLLKHCYVSGRGNRLVGLGKAGRCLNCILKLALLCSL